MDFREYQKRKRQKNFLRRWAILLIFFLVPAILLWSFFWIPYFRISNIQIEGYDNAARLKNLVFAGSSSTNIALVPKNHFFLVSPSKIAALIKKEGFGVADVSKKLPNTLIIKFAQHAPWLIFCPPAGRAGSNTCFYVAKNGVLSDFAPRFSENPLPMLKISVPEAELGQEVIPPETADRVFKFNADLKTINALMTAVEISESIKISLKEDWQIYLDKNFDPIKISRDLELLLREQIKDGRKNLEYIDMRFENKAFYKLR